MRHGLWSSDWSHIEPHVCEGRRRRKREKYICYSFISLSCSKKRKKFVFLENYILLQKRFVFLELYFSFLLTSPTAPPDFAFKKRKRNENHLILPSKRGSTRKPTSPLFYLHRRSKKKADVTRNWWIWSRWCKSPDSLCALPAQHM